MSSLIIFGAGGHGRVVDEAARLSGNWSDIVFADDLFPSIDEVNNIPVVTDFEQAKSLQSTYDSAVVALGDNVKRLRITQSLLESGFNLPIIIHPSATVSKFATIGEGTVICAGAVIQANAVIGKAAIINTSVSVDHDCLIGDGCHLCPGTHLGGDVQIGKHAFLGVGVSVVRGIKIGANSNIGAGAAVISDVPDGVRAVGVPARTIENGA